MACVRTAVWSLPRILLAVSAVFLALGLSWRHVSDADTVNGSFIVVALVLGALAICTLCIRAMPQLHTNEKRPPMARQTPPENARLPLVSV